MRNLLKKIVEGKLQRDILWNYSSLLVLGVSGIGLQVLIAYFYDASALGVFNQVLAAYIFFGQAASWGLNYSVLKAVAEHSQDRSERSRIIVSAILIAFTMSALFTSVFLLLRGPLSHFLASSEVKEGMTAISVGLFFFGINKVLLAVVNGMQRMRAFAVYQSLRYIFILISLFFGIYLSIDGAYLAFVFSAAESLLFLILLFEVALHIRWVDRVTSWVQWHFNFGLKSLPSGVLIELNSRVDVLMLGHFLSDRVVGIYSFAAMFVEGIYQLLVVLQNNLNPIVAQHVHQRELLKLEVLVRKAKRYTYAFMSLAGVVLILLYPVIVECITNKPEFLDSWSIFGILVGAMVITAGYLPFHHTLVMAGYPGWQSVFMLSVVLFNIVANYSLVPHYGALGAALGTGLAFVFSILLLKLLVYRQVKLRI